HHPSHPGYTLKEEKINRLFTCDGCKEVGFGTCYTCTDTACNFHLHKQCANPVVPDRRCDACGRDINGYVYHCDKKDLDLHPCCAKLPYYEDVVINEGEEIRLFLKKKVSTKCCKCKEKKLWGKVKNTWSYVSENQEVHFHVSCVKDLVYESWRDGLQIEKVDANWPKTKLEVYKESKWKGSGRSKFGTLKKVLKIALTFIIAVVIGDPTAMLVGVVTSFITH
ncbi:DC1 domain-containing protein, partial [Dioscorea alata]